MDRQESWLQATQTGYQGPRGALLPMRPFLPDPAPAALTPIYF